MSSAKKTIEGGCFRLLGKWIWRKSSFRVFLIMYTENPLPHGVKLQGMERNPTSKWQHFYVTVSDY